MKTSKILIAMLFTFGLISQLNAQSVSTRDITQPISEFIACANGGAGEDVAGVISIHAVIHTNKDGIVTSVHFQPQGGMLTGQTTGTRFQATGVTAERFNVTNGATTGTFINRFHFVGQGGIQFRAFDTIHFTVNANGELTADVANSSVECK